MAEEVRHFMRRGAITCNEDTSVTEVAQVMFVNRVRYSVVVNKQHEVVGIISADSILRAYGSDFNTTKARDILYPYSLVTTPSAPLKEAIGLMCRKKVEHLIVVSDRPGSKAVIGILSSRDIIKNMAEAQEDAHSENL